jgi:ferredoxin
MMQKNNINKKIILHYSDQTVGEPIVYLLVKEYDLIPNIIKASINPDQEGHMLLGLTGTEENYQAALVRLQELNINVQCLADKVYWDKHKCTQCGACTAVCPSQALSLQRPQMTIDFCGDKCVVCHMCIEACPVNAVTMDF